LVCFEKDALEENVPNKRTIITENHKIFYKGEMRRAKTFLNDFEKVKMYNTLEKCCIMFCWKSMIK